MRLWHYTNEQNFKSIIRSTPGPGRIAVELERADGYGTVFLYLSLQQLNQVRPDGIDAHFGDGLYVTDIRPGSMKMQDICKHLWTARASRSTNYIDRVKYHIQFEVNELFIPCRQHVYKINFDKIQHWNEVKIVKHGRTKELTERGSEHL